MKIIAVDFDGTLCKDAYPAIGTPNTDVIRRLKQEQANGTKTILWTCREGALLFEAVTWCTQHDLTFNAINNNIPEQVAQYNNNCRKVYADEYWDDRAVGVEGKWLTDEFFRECSNCHIAMLLHEHERLGRFQYCPHCGAKMDLED